ncbi:hypothetical protein [Pseudoclavibacter sp. RFBA6]|uniref:hypothetical protein n=1 Tax=Pseudoclavibacter sp. RFBA6 TaxID=2080573 RepID=UPI000CE896BE|nr:hypothetical protein [Pseudoclavibacter sp. RFBA6]PPG40457.1 hypothetical protein C5C17_06490 [Pseudoclavibacter sp. RFBA6]
MTFDAWGSFFVATVGAGAALAGLIMVPMSVNVATIIKITTMPSRAGATIASLLLIEPGSRRELGLTDRS